MAGESPIPRSLRWISTSSDVWRDRLALGLWLFAAAAYARWCWLSPTGIGAAHIAAGVILLLALGLLARAGLVRLLGPVLAYDIIRNSRRTRFIFVRWVYVVFLLMLLVWVHSIWLIETRYNTGQSVASYRDMTKLAERYFIAFSITQFCLVALLTPAYVAGAIAEEKERKTLEFLLATDLENREIVLGKLVSRLGNLALFVLAGLPVLSIMQFFGGIDPGLLLASFAATGLTALGLSGLSILNSTFRRRARDAIALTYFGVIGYMALTGVTAFLRSSMGFAGLLNWGGIDWNWYFSAFHSGNPIFGLFAVTSAIATNGPLDAVIADELRDYAIFQVLLFIVTVTWAVLRLRSIALNQVAVIGPRARKSKKPRQRRLAIGDNPMRWKELWIEGRVRLGWIGRIGVGLLVGAGFIPVVVMFYTLLTDRGVFGVWRDVGEPMNVWLRSMNVLVSVLMLLGVAVRAAGSVSGERDRDTLNSLMTTPLTTSEIIGAKWLGAVFSVRGFAWWLASIWLITIICGGVHPMAVPLQVAAWFAPAFCFAAIGLLFSAACRTTLRATAWTIATVILVGGGHWICMFMCCMAPLGVIAGSGGRGIEWLAYAELAVTPPFIFGWDPFREFRDLSLSHDYSMPGFAAAGMGVWCVAAFVFWSLARERFERLTNRQRGSSVVPVARPLDP